VIHDRHLIGHDQRLALVVGDVDEGGSETVLELLQLHLHVLAQLQIQRAEGLVEQEHVGFQNHGAGDGHALLLPAGKLRNALGAVARQADALQRVLHLAGDFRRRLKHHVDGTPVRRFVEHGAPLDENVARVRLQETGDHAQQSGLAAAGWAENGKE